LASPPEITTQDLERKLNSILLADSQIQFALACKALSQQDLGPAEIYADKAMSFDPAKTQPRVVATQICLAKIMRLEAGLGSASDSRPELIKSAERNAREAIRLAEIEKDTRSQLEARTLLVDILLLLDRKKKALDEADRAVQLNPNSIQALMARSQAQFENDIIGEGINSLERAYAIEPRADVAFHYGKALFTRSKDNDLQLSVTVLAGIDLATVVPMMRHAMAMQTWNSVMKTKDWERAKIYLDANEPLLGPDSLSVLRGLLAHYRQLPQEPESQALKAQSLITPATPIDVKVHLARLFMLIGRPTDALPLFQEAFDSNVTTFDPGELMDCAARLRRDDVVIATFRTLRKRGVNDWNTVSFGLQHVQRYHPSEAIEVLNAFLGENSDHKLAKLFRSVLGLVTNRPELVCGAVADVPAVEDLPFEHVMQVIHVLRSVGNADASVDYAYRFLRLHFKRPEAHRALLLSMSPFEPMPDIQPALDRVEIGAAVRYEELPNGDPDWIVIEDTEHPSSDLKELKAGSQLATELLGKQVGDTFLLARGMIDRRGVIRQIVPKYVRAYNDCGDRWQIRFPGEAMIQSVHLGNTEEQVSESIDLIFQALQKRAETEVEMRKMYNTVSTPLHVFGDWHGTNAYDALIILASAEDQPVRNAFGTLEERSEALTVLKATTSLVLDLSAIATIRLLEIDRVLTTTNFKFVLTENSWRQLRETFGDKSRSDSSSIAVEFRDGKRIMHEETVEFKKKRAEANQAFLDLVAKQCEIVPVEAVASLPPEKRDPFEKMFGQYGVESMLLASRPGYLLWSDDLVQSQMAATEFGARRAWTQIVLTFLAELDATWTKDRDIATAKLVGMDYRITFFDCSSIIEAVHLTGAIPWESPLKNLIRQFESPDADLKSLFPILEELVVRIYREALLPEHRCRVMNAVLDAIWKNPAARRSIMNLRSKSAWIFGLNPIGASQFDACFDKWFKLLENPILTGL
jgi:tetratricopeptide (TPR) repeat protein